MLLPAAFGTSVRSHTQQIEGWSQEQALVCNTRLTSLQTLTCDVFLCCCVSASPLLRIHVSLLPTAAAAVTMEEAMPDLLSPFC